MTSRTSSSFRRDFIRLPSEIQRQTARAHRRFLIAPQHPSLKFKKLPPFDDIWSVRINNDYRAVGRWRGDVILWFFIGSHSDYDRLLASLK